MKTKFITTFFLFVFTTLQTYSQNDIDTSLVLVMI